MGFKENLQDELFYQGISAKELASLSGVSAGTISNYLKQNSSTPSADIAVKLAKALGVSVEFLVDGNKENTKVNEYSPEIRSYVNKILKLTERDQKILFSIINTLYEDY